MPNLRSLDAACHIDQQLRSTADPVVLVNLLTVAEADFPALKFAWQTDTNWMQQQPGFVSFVSALAAFRSSAVAQPHLFAKVAVPNLCAA